jgi:decaprenylphospho-beta-D-ribofuranose 2-oxidase
MHLEGWGRYPTVDAQMVAPSSAAAARAVLLEDAAPLIARGNGRSYGDSSLAGRVLATRNLRLLRAFDATTGELRCEAGVLLSELLEVFVPRGWFLPVTPGTKYVSVAGAIASDVHGKNHHVDGCFSEFVDSFELLQADGGTITCSRELNADCFRATCGGMGLTGVVLEARLRLKPIRSAYIEQTTIKAGNLAAALECLAASEASTYSVAWIDCLARGARMGRSLVMTGEHAATGPLLVRTKAGPAIPFDMPPQLLNPHALRAFNALYYHRVQRAKQQQRVHYEPYFYPLDGLRNWNRLYGKSGFVQYQCLIPTDRAHEGLTRVLRRISESGRGSFLAVLKLFGRQNDNLLSFPLAGYTLALDFKLGPGLLELLDELDRIVLDYEGRLYLAKDARMSEATFKRSYPRWQEFQALRERTGALARFASAQSRRLGLN